MGFFLQEKGLILCDIENENSFRQDSNHRFIGYGLKSILLSYLTTELFDFLMSVHNKYHTTVFVYRSVVSTHVFGKLWTILNTVKIAATLILTLDTPDTFLIKMWQEYDIKLMEWTQFESDSYKSILE